ncbi:hypothetical protein Y11_20921 [Yersinia enterocolitica subsp. palearctica Y11]|uniref:Uncharacterized protein n=1 Tax=Yersinia enterocolitica subsp. palearctica serotype O:3 (strain DSM 13030 / CIP 106945 / Y11) TaxID=930944 RepID=A0A0H3NY84_YERE1|nr:hypothetical protein Y11_20921 [Yersinia enterocolitica subsp. palearctica Y11]CCO69695.1 hypothetical protein D322_2821 [Yersinia enterocolitica IP 10393]
MQITANFPYFLQPALQGSRLAAYFCEPAPHICGLGLF